MGSTSSGCSRNKYSEVYSLYSYGWRPILGFSIFFPSPLTICADDATFLYFTVRNDQELLAKSFADFPNGQTGSARTVPWLPIWTGMVLVSSVGHVDDLYIRVFRRVSRTMAWYSSHVVVPSARTASVRWMPLMRAPRERRRWRAPNRADAGGECCRPIR